MRVGRLFDWIVDVGTPAALMFGLLAIWLVAVVLMFFAAWWLGLIGLALGAPFAYTFVTAALEDRRV